MLTRKQLTRSVLLCYSPACLPLANHGLLSSRHLHFCLPLMQVFSFQKFAHSLPRRPSHNPLFINHFDTLFIMTEGIPPQLSNCPSISLSHLESTLMKNTGGYYC